MRQHVSVLRSGAKDELVECSEEVGCAAGPGGRELVLMLGEQIPCLTVHPHLDDLLAKTGEPVLER